MAQCSQNGFSVLKKWLRPEVIIVMMCGCAQREWEGFALCPLWFDTVTCGQEEVSIFDIDGHGERASFGHMIEMYMYIHRNDIACLGQIPFRRRHTPTFDTK